MSDEQMGGAPAALARRIADARLDWIVPRWDAPANVGALVTTRNGGVGSPPRATLNLGLSSSDAGADAADAVAENRARLRSFLPSEPIWLRQVHGTRVVHLPAPHEEPPIVADAAVTRTPGVVCAVLVADCLPVLLADRPGTVVAAAHAGWRGLAAGVVEATIEQMDADPRTLAAWLGPAIGPAAFEVGDDVRRAFCDADRDAARMFTPLREGKWLADLRSLARRRLERAGVTSIGSVDECTYSDAARFFSFRRDGITGRMAATIWLEQRASV